MYKIIPHSRPFVSQEDIEVVARQVELGMHASGDITKEFEDKFSKFIGIQYAKATNSGTNSLHLALLSLGIKEDDEVMIPSYICASVLSAVNYTRARAVLADIDPEFDKKGYNISARTIESKITKNTKAVIVPHMFGTLVEIDDIKKFGIPIIEDCAHSLGAEYKRRKVGSLGDMSIFSFYATKIISTGSGGMAATSNDKISARLEDLTQYDERDKYGISYNYSLSDIQSALGIKQLEKLQSFIERRRFIGEKYDREFSRVGLKIPPKLEGSFPFRYILRFSDKKERDNIKNRLARVGVKTELPIFRPLHQYLELDKKDFEATEDAYNTSLSLPIYPALQDDDIDYKKNV